MSANTLALIFDFDDTLTDDSTTKLLEKHGIDTKDFWRNKADTLVRDQGWDPTFAYLHLLLGCMENKTLPPLTNEDLRAFGKTLKPYPGLEALLKDLRKVAHAELFDIEFYIISGGLQDIIEGFKLRSEFAAVWGCQLAPSPTDPKGPVRHIKRAITFTEKTRYVFEINKGIKPEDAAKNPYLVNQDIPYENRRIPFSHMIYIGDGLSDIPCMSVITKHSNPGRAFGVFEPDSKSAKTMWKEMLAPQPPRVTSAHFPRYGKTHELGALLRAMVTTRCSDLKLAKA